MEIFCQKAVAKVKKDFESVLTTSLKIENQMIEERSRSSGSDSLNMSSFHLNVNPAGLLKSP